MGVGHRHSPPGDEGSSSADLVLTNEREGVDVRELVVAAARGEALDAEALPHRVVEGVDPVVGLLDCHALELARCDGELGAPADLGLVVGLVDQGVEAPLPEDVLLARVPPDVGILEERIAQLLLGELLALRLVVAAPATIETSHVELVARRGEVGVGTLAVGILAEGVDPLSSELVLDWAEPRLSSLLPSVLQGAAEPAVGGQGELEPVAQENSRRVLMVGTREFGSGFELDG